MIKCQKRKTKDLDLDPICSGDNQEQGRAPLVHGDHVKQVEFKHQHSSN